jgi:hypothetical protein
MKTKRSHAGFFFGKGKYLVEGGCCRSNFKEKVIFQIESLTLV